MSRRLSLLERKIGSRPEMTLVVEGMFVREIWINGRAPIITLHDYDWGETDPDPAFDAEGFAFSPINWRGPAWTLGLSLHPPLKETYTMANQRLKTIALSDLKVSKLNMRHSRKKPDVSDILPSIRTHGLRQSLLVREEGKHYGIVAGRRRLFALKQIAKERGTDVKVPCIVMRAGDDAEAIEASILENVARLPATEMQQYVAFDRLSQQGRTPTEIAEYFGITELTVRRVLALARLLPDIRNLYSEDEITVETARTLTLATTGQQDQWLKLFNAKTGIAPTGRSLKDWIAGGKAISADKALFDLESYDGRILDDLFGDAGIFEDGDLFWEAQSTALAARLETYHEKGWSDCHVLDRGQFFQSWDYQKRGRTKGGKVIVEVRHDGTVTFYEGYISNADARKLERAASKDGAENKAVRPEMTQAMAAYLVEHRRLAVGAVMLSQPGVGLRLAVAHMLVGSGLWQVRGHKMRAKNDAIIDSLEQSKAAHEIKQTQGLVSEMLKAHGIANVCQNGDDYHLSEVFAALLGMSDDEVLLILTSAMAASLEAGTATIEALAVATETDMSAYWKPDQVFFDLLRDKRAINAMIAEMASPSVAKGCLTETAKVQKEILANRITGEGCTANSDWRPAWMAVPPRGYIDGAPCLPFDQWRRVAGMFTSDDTKEECLEANDAIAA